MFLGMSRVMLRGSLFPLYLRGDSRWRGAVAMKVTNHALWPSEATPFFSIGFESLPLATSFLALGFS
jgi:hypothetical protein